MREGHASYHRTGSWAVLLTCIPLAKGLGNIQRLVFHSVEAGEDFIGWVIFRAGRFS